MGQILGSILVGPELNRRSMSLVFLDLVTFSQGSKKTQQRGL